MQEHENEEPPPPPWPYDNMADWELMERIREAALEYKRREREDA